MSASTASVASGRALSSTSFASAASASARGPSHAHRPSDGPSAVPAATPLVPAPGAEPPRGGVRLPVPAAGRVGREAIERLDDEIARLSAQIQAVTGRLLRLIAAFDATEGWYGQSFRSCAQWLAWRTGLGPGAAREKVRVARALEALPMLRRELGRGRLSYSAARALTRVATPENEAELVEVARHTTAADLERLVGAWRAAERGAALALEEERARHAGRTLALVCEADGGWRIRGRLDPEVGALLGRALEAAERALHAGEAGAAREVEATAGARRADALGLVAERALAGPLRREAGKGGAEKTGRAPEAGPPPEAGTAPPVGRAGCFEVVVHLEVDGTARLEHGPHVSAETARRLACEASRVSMLHGPDGRARAVGRRTRTVPAALRRALAHRDGRCRFPGCGCRYVDAHHIKPWAEGGETTLENLVLLCRRHHRLLHEEGWRLRGDARQGFRFLRPDGSRLPEVPPPPDLGARPVEALARAQRGLGIDAHTPTPAWDGAPLDVDWALYTLGQNPPVSLRPRRHPILG